MSPPELPIELYPIILGHLQNRTDLYRASFVCSTFNRFANELLYRELWIRPWVDKTDDKLPLLFRSLAGSNHLAHLVRRLEIRSYPPTSLLSPSLESDTLTSLLTFNNLTSIAWNRHHSLSNEFISAIASLPLLRDLEINAHSKGVFDPERLFEILSIKKLSLIMPSRSVVDLLERWLERLAEGSEGGLEGLSVITKSSTYITDDHLRAWAPSLSSLTQLSLVACTRITHEGVAAILRSSVGFFSLTGETSRSGINHLCLDHCDRLIPSLLQPHMRALLFDLGFLSIDLSSIDAKLDVPTFFLPFRTTLHSLHVPTHSPIDGFFDTCLPPQGLPLLKLLSIPSSYYLDLPINAAHLLPSLQHLFVTADRSSLAVLLEIVKEFKGLRTLHILSGPFREDEVEDPTENDLLWLAVHAGPPLRQIGMRTKVYEVVRTIDYSLTSTSHVRRDAVEIVPWQNEGGARVPDFFALSRLA